MNKAFTLLELLVVVAIMGLLGTATVGGYRQMQRGMEERGVTQTVESFLSAAFQRAQVDQMPVAVYFWNETLSEENEMNFEHLVVVGHAVAVRQCGRISRVDGDYLLDEFGDLEQYELDPDGKTAYLDEESESTMRLYLMGDRKDRRLYSNVFALPRPRSTLREFYVTYDPNRDGHNQNADAIIDTNEKGGSIVQFGYQIESGEKSAWHNGSAYGFEFQTITLPHGYLFGTDYSTDVNNPIRDVDSAKVIYTPGMRTTTKVSLASLRPNDSGVLAPKVFGSADVSSEARNAD